MIVATEGNGSSGGSAIVGYGGGPLDVGAATRGGGRPPDDGVGSRDGDKKPEGGATSRNGGGPPEDGVVGVLTASNDAIRYIGLCDGFHCSTIVFFIICG
ncbi:unnamed protein product [Lactuca saligna]|uniref:Uncharacterized protein n=1 Tax=Lactuca saligna TaxID=75948 RepID=A0AA36ECC1_LACSI|nr:unnamed protein product [Lactuca saligna]